MEARRCLNHPRVVKLNDLNLFLLEFQSSSLLVAVSVP